MPNTSNIPLIHSFNKYVLNTCMFCFILNSTAKGQTSLDTIQLCVMKRLDDIPKDNIESKICSCIPTSDLSKSGKTCSSCIEFCLSDVNRGQLPITTGPQNNATKPQKLTYFLNSLQFTIAPSELTTGSSFPKIPKASIQNPSASKLPAIYATFPWIMYYRACWSLTDELWIIEPAGVWLPEFKSQFLPLTHFETTEEFEYGLSITR